MRISDWSSDVCSSDLERLTEYMKSFTRPLVVNVFGATNDNIKSSGQIINMFSNIDRDVALKNMRKIANMMGITISDIPDFLEKYGDIYLSLSYFRRCLDETVPQFDHFAEWMEELEGGRVGKEWVRPGKSRW